MKKVHISRKFFLVLLVFTLAMMILGLLAGCAKREPYTYDVAYEDSDRFQVVYSQSMYPSVGCIDIIIDKETNIKYMLIKRADGVGVTKLEE